MWNPRLQTGPQGHIQALAIALETNAACARLALACSYSSSDEYEAELIRARRAAGVYGPRHHRQAYIAFAMAAAAIVAVLFAL